MEEAYPGKILEMSTRKSFIELLLMRRESNVLCVQKKEMCVLLRKMCVIKKCTLLRKKNALRNVFKNVFY